MTDDTIANVNFTEVKRDIYAGIAECNIRGLVHSAKWLAELNYGLLAPATSSTPSSTSSEFPFRNPNVTVSIDISTAPPATDPGKGKDNTDAKFTSGIAADEYDRYFLAKSYFDCREYDRSAYFTENCESPVPKFLHYYALYMAKEKKRLENMTDSANFNQSGNCKDLNELQTTLMTMYAQSNMDAYMLYLLGVLLKKLDIVDLAISIFIESIHLMPTLWSSWNELGPLITDTAKLNSLNFPNHWMKHIFMARTLIQLSLNDEGLKMFEDLQAAGFRKCVFITSQMAIAYHNKRNVDKAISIFKNLQEVDPYRLDNLDIFSNLLFVKELKKEMAFLAHKAVEIDKYRPETCCVIGNYYSIRSDHQKAVTYFQRALKLNPNYLSAWTLMGHEFMEMKNTNAAIQSYRKGVEVNRRDYRAWYGLGQSYEILKMPFYSLYYYKIAQEIRPHDSRMLVALGETYEKLDKNANALKCFQKACNVGDIEGIALLRLADLYYKLGIIGKAIPAYLNFCSDEHSTVDKGSLCRAFVTLGNYYESIGNYDEASYFAYKCLEHDDTKSEARSLLKSIENNRALAQPPTKEKTPKFNNCEMSMDESDMDAVESSVMMNETQGFDTTAMMNETQGFLE